MGGIKKRAGLFVTDKSGNTCCIIRSVPYREKADEESSSHRNFSLPIYYPWYNSDSNITGNKRSPHIPSVNCDDVFLEMIQIPRGMKEKGDKDLLHTAVREFCEETLCANNPLYVSDEPIELFWEDGGNKWSYNIYIAKVDSYFYFAFDPSAMQTVDLKFPQSTDNTRTYRLHTAAINLTRTGDTICCLVVMNTLDYVHYMQNVQLPHYGANNYSQLLAKIEKQSFPQTSDYKADSVNVYKDFSTTSATKSTGSCTDETLSNLNNFNDSDYRAENKGTTVRTISPIIHDSVKDNRDIYLNLINFPAYSSALENSYMRWQWSSHWNNNHYMISEESN